MYDVLVIGGGIAGLRAALAARSLGATVAVVSKAHPTRSHSVTLQDGFNAALSGDDSWEAHASDTTAWGDGLNAPDVVNGVCRDAPELVWELDRMGVPFNRADGRADGRVDGRAEGRADGAELARLKLRGASQARAAFVDDMSGLTITHTLYEQAIRAQAEFYAEWIALSLIVERDACRGVVALNLATGKLETLASKAVVLATGAPRRLYEPSTASLLCTGDGTAMAYRAGVPLVDMEFVQYHPAVLKGSRLAVSELVWAYDASLEEKDGAAALRVSWAPGVAEERFFNTRYRLKELAGVDIAAEPIPVRPAMHRLLGGVAVDARGATEMAGLYAAGGCAGTGFHGAAGLDGNFLLASVSSGKQAGLAAGEHAGSAPDSEPSSDALKLEQAVIEDVLQRDAGGGSVAAMREELAGLMHRHAGQSRDEGDLKKALQRTGEMRSERLSLGLNARGNDYNFALVQYLDLGSLLDVAQAIVASALARPESRGVHVRTDHPARDDDGWRKHLRVSASDTGPQVQESSTAAP